MFGHVFEGTGLILVEVGHCHIVVLRILVDYYIAYVEAYFLVRVELSFHDI